jgi:hypothetical protein
MTPKGPRSERETVINFNEEEETATGGRNRKERPVRIEYVKHGG